METLGGDGSKMELVMRKKGKHKSMTGISASLTPDYREKEESNNNIKKPSPNIFPYIFSTEEFYFPFTAMQRI